MGPGKVNGLIAQFLERIGLTSGGVATAGTPAVSSVTAGVGSPETMLNGKRYNDLGAAVKAGMLLPLNPSVGSHVWVSCVNANGLRVTAQASTTIQIGDVTSAAAGYFETVRPGSAVHLVCTSPTTWVADEVVGTWRADSTTSSGFAHTPTPWTAWTPTSTFTNTTWTGAYRQVGQNLEMQIRGICTGTPAAATALRFTIPYGTIARQPSTQYVLNGSGFAWDATATTFYGPFLFVWETSTTFTLYHTNGTTSMAAVISSTATPFIWAVNDECYVSVSVPLA